MGRVLVKGQETLPLTFEGEQQFPNTARVKPSLEEQKTNLMNQFYGMQNVDPKTFMPPEDVTGNISNRHAIGIRNRVMDAYDKAASKAIHGLMADEQALEWYPDIWENYMNALQADAASAPEEQREYPNTSKGKMDRLRHFRNKRYEEPDFFPENLKEYTKTLPGLRDYHSMQSTLPQHMPSLHSEKWLDSKGNPIPGAIPPVNAIRIMNQPAIESLMSHTGGGLIPIYNPDAEHYEKQSYNIDVPFKVDEENPGFFATSNTLSDIDNATISIPREGMVGIRGFHGERDNAQMRAKNAQREDVAEAYIGNKIPNTRIVPFTHGGKWVSRHALIPYWQRKDTEDADIGYRGYGGITDEKIKENQSMTDYVDSLPVSLGGENFSHMADKFGFPKLHGKPFTEEDKKLLTGAPYPSKEQERFNSKLREYKKLLTENAITQTGLPISWGTNRMHTLNNLSPHEKMKYIQFIRDKGLHKL